MEIFHELPVSGVRCTQRLPLVEGVRAAGRKHSLEFRHNSRVLEEQLSALRKENDGLRQTLLEAVQMQRRLCGPRQARRGAFEVSGEIFPVHHVSGDFISVFDNRDDLVLVLGDISGKGLSAGMWFPHLIATIQRHLLMNSPAAALTAINSELCSAQIAVPLSTLFLASLNIGTGAVDYCNAGHPPALLLRQTGEAEKLDKGGPVLGVVPSARFVGGETVLGPGDSLLAYSDGIVECRNGAGVEFGMRRLVSAARLSHSSSASGRLFSVLGAAEDFRGDQERDDDMALLVVRRDEHSFNA
jgi:serine phosphatase RsbU (regulator of sigma subunit)